MDDWNEETAVCSSAEMRLDLQGAVVLLVGWVTVLVVTLT